MSAPPLTSIVSVEDQDVLLENDGMKGQKCLLQHPEFRKLLEAHQEEYAQTPKLQQPVLSLKIVDMWRQQNGRFLKRDSQRNLYFDVGDEKARRQITKALRSLLRKQDSSRSTTDSTVSNDHSDSLSTQTQLMPSRVGSVQVSLQSRTVSSSIRQNAQERRLYSRSNDQESLLKLYQKSIVDDGNSTQLVVISGPPGVGKTALALSLEPKVLADNGYFVRAKFAELLPEEPLAIYRSILGDVVQILHSLPDTHRQREVFGKIVDAAGDDMAILCTVAPVLRNVTKILAHNKASGAHTVEEAPCLRSQPMSISRVTSDFLKEHIDEGGDTEPIGVNTHSVRRFEYAFLKVLKALASPDHPLVILMDDIQWANNANVLEEQLAELASKDNGGLFFIFTYRVDPCDMVAAKSRLEDMLNVGSAKIQKSHCSLSGLPQEAIHELLSDSLALEPGKLEVLGRTLSELTGGNILFVLELLRVLQDDDLLRYDDTSKQWICDDHLLRQHPILQVRTLRNLFRAKVLDLEPHIQDALKTCSCLGLNFRRDVVLRVIDKGSFEVVWKLCEKNGLLVQYCKDDHEYLSFGHDSMFQAAYSLIPEDQREVWHLKIGRKLWDRTKENNEFDNFLFVILEQLFLGKLLITEAEDRIVVASLCLEAGKDAVSKTGFELPAMYLQKGIELLGPQKWHNHKTYDLCLGLFNNAIDACYAIGQLDTVEKLIDEVLKNARVFQDELQARVMLIYSLGTKRQLPSAIQLGVETLALLGLRLDRNPSKFQVFLALRKAKKLLNGKSNGFLLSLPTMTDQKLISCQIVLNVMFISAYYENLLLATLISCHMVELSVVHGASVVSCVGFAMFGTVVMRGGSSLDESRRYAQIALDLAGRFGGETWLCRISAFVYGLLNIWLEPMPYCLAQLKHAYQVGLGGGDIEYAMINASLYIWDTIDRLPMPELEAEARNLTDRMKFLGQEKGAFMLRPVWQMSLNFLGLAHGDPKLLTGEVLKEESIEHLARVTGRGRALYANATVYKMMLAYHFSDYQLAESYSQTVAEVYSALGSLGCALARFYDALSVLASKAVRRKQFSTVRKHLKVLRYWAKRCPQNNMGKLCLVEAELARVTGDRLEAKSKYYCAIVHARDGGILMEHALANERAGKFYHSVGDDMSAIPFLKQAFRLYKEWGGTAKLCHFADEIRHIVDLGGEFKGHL